MTEPSINLTARGNERNRIYREEGDYHKFLEILSELLQRYGILIYGYVLMGNHYHLLIETPEGNITRVMHYLNATYTGYFNKKYKRVGHLFHRRPLYVLYGVNLFYPDAVPSVMHDKKD